MTRHFTIREATPRDTSSLLALKRRLAEETKFLLLEPDEVPGEQALGDLLRTVNRTDNAAWFIAETGGEAASNDGGNEAIGMLGVTGGSLARNRATAKLFLGIAKQHWGRGLGRGLLSAAEDWARDKSVRRLELTVNTENERARTLYKRMGFVTEGRMRAALVVDGKPVDEYLMGKVI